MLRDVLDVIALLERRDASGAAMATLLRETGPGVEVGSETVHGDRGSTDFVRILIPGREGRSRGGERPTLGIIGRHGGIGARPSRIGFVSDGDGAAAAFAAALRLARMHAGGDVLPGDVIVTSHVCPDAPVIPHEPVEFMSSPVGMETMNRHEVDAAMDAIVSIDTTKGNRVLNYKGIAISPTVMRGWILRVSDDLVAVAETVTGEPAHVFPLSMADITPYGNGVYHINSILQPATATDAPVVGLAITTTIPVAGSATGASDEVDIARAARFAVEVAKGFTGERLRFHQPEDLERLVALYGDMTRLQTPGGSDS